MRKWIPLWVYPVLLLFAVGTVWLRLSVVGKTYEINQIGKLIKNSNNELEKVKIEVAKLRSPIRLEKLAKRNLSFRLRSRHK